MSETPAFKPKKSPAPPGTVAANTPIFTFVGPGNTLDLRGHEY